jgi:DNA-binding FadR family transcriptional regulator
MTDDQVPTFKPVRRRSFEEVATQIRERIEDGTFGVGDKLPAERALAEQLGVSRNTVREALRALEYTGLLNQRPGSAGGAFVSDGSIDVIRSAFDNLMRLGTVTASDLMEARLAIGRQVAMLACERYTDDDWQALVENIEATREAALAGDLRRRVRHSLAFHDLLAAAAKSPVLRILSGVLTDITTHFVRARGEMPNEFVIASRERMLQHLRARDGTKAADEMHAYLSKALGSYLQGVELPAAALALWPQQRRGENE